MADDVHDDYITREKMSVAPVGVALVSMGTATLLFTSAVRNSGDELMLLWACCFQFFDLKDG